MGNEKTPSEVFDVLRNLLGEAGEARELMGHAKKMAQLNERLVRVLDDNGFSPTVETAMMLMLTGMLMAAGHKRLLPALVVTLKGMQMTGQIPGPKPLSSVATDHPEVISETLKIFLGGRVEMVTSAEEMAAKVREATEGEPARATIESFPWLRSRR